MKNYIISATLLAFVLSGCSDKERESELQSQIKQLEIELDDCKNGAAKLLAKIQIDFEDEKWIDVKLTHSIFESRHPESEEFKEANDIYEKVLLFEEKQRVEEEKKRIEAENLLKKEKEDRLRALKKLKKESDDISGVTWYYNPYFTHYNNRNNVSVYIGKRESSKPWMRLKMSYNGDDWIFFEKAFLSYNGNTLEIPFDKYDDKESDNSGGEVWEWIDVSVTPEIETFLRDLANSTNPKMRLSGKYTETRNLTYTEKKAIRDVINGYQSLKDE